MGIKNIEIDSNVDKVLKTKDAAVAKALEMIGLQAEKYVKEKITTNRSVVTGRLRNSITHDVHAKDEEVHIGTAVEYAPYVEYGHLQEVGRYVPELGKRLVAPRVDGKPYLKPAIESHKDEYKRIAEQCLKNG